MKNGRIPILITLLLLFSPLGGCGGALLSPKTRTIHLSLILGESSDWYAGANRFKELVEQHSQGRFQVKLDPKATLSNSNQESELENVQNGVLQASIESTILLSTLDQRFSVWSLPWLFTDHEQAGRAEDQERHDVFEARRAGMQQQPGARSAPQQRRQGEVPDPPAGAVEFLAVAPHAAHRRRPQRHRARGIGDQRRDPEPDDGGIGQQRAAAGDRIDRPADRRRQHHQDQLQGRHAPEVCRGGTNSASSLWRGGGRLHTFVVPMAFLDRRSSSRRRADHERDRLFELSLDLLAVVGTDGAIRQANASWQRLLGWPVEELVGMPFLELLPDEAQPGAAVAFDELRRGGPQRTFEHQFHDHAGGSRWVEWNATPDPENEAIYVAARDIMGRKLAEAESARLAAIVDSSNDAIVSASLAGVIESWNPAAEHIFGYAAADVLGRPLTMLVPRMSTDRTSQMLGEVSLGHLLTNMDVERRRKDGTLVRVALTLSPVRNADGAVIATSVIARLLGEGVG